MNATFLLVDKIKMMMLFNVVHRKVHKNMTKKGPLPVGVLRSKVVFGFPSCRFIVLWVKWVYELWVKSWVRSALACITCALLAMRGERWAKRETKGGEKLINKYFIFSSPPPALRVKCRVGLAWLLKRLLCRSRSALNSEPLFGFLRRSFSSRVFHHFGDFVINTHTECL